MIEFVIAGKRSVGKSFFMLQFAEYIANENGYDCLYQSDKGVQLRKISDQGTAMDIYNKGSKNGDLPKCITLFHKPQEKLFKFTDTYSLHDGIQCNQQERKQIKQSLQKIVESEYLIHILDSNQLEKRGLDELNQELYNIGKRKRCYIMLVNKADTTNTVTKVAELQKKLGVPLFPVSVKYKEGFFHVYQSIRSILKEQVLGR